MNEIEKIKHVCDCVIEIYKLAKHHDIDSFTLYQLNRKIGRCTKETSCNIYLLKSLYSLEE